MPATRAPKLPLAASTTLVEADFSHGVVADADPGALASGQLIADFNFMLDKPGKAYKRGGYAYIGDAAGTQNLRVEVAEFPTPASPEILSWNSDLKLYRLVAGHWTAAGAPTNFGPDSGYFPRQHPVVVPDPTNTTTGGSLVWGVAAGNDRPRVYDGNGAAPRAISGSTGITSDQGGRYFSYYKSRLVLAASTKYENRMWFSPPGVLADIEAAWDIAESYIDFDYGITGLAALSNVLLVFSRSHVERLSGSAPPPGSDMSHGVIGRNGCVDSRSIGLWNDNAIWASLDGLYMSSGQAPNDLTLEGGIKSAWITDTGGWVEGSSYIVGTTYRNYYFVTISTGSGNRTWVLDIPRRVWWKLSFNANVPWWYAWNPVDASKFYAVLATNRICDLAPFFAPSATNRTDANNGTITGTLTPRYLNAGAIGLKQWRDGRLDFQMYHSGGGSPTLNLTMDGKAAGSFGSASFSSPGTAIRGRAPFTISGDDPALALSISQASDCDLCEIYGLEIDYRPFPLSRGGAV